MASDYFQTKDVYRNMYFSSDNALMKRAVFPASKSVLDMELPGKAREGLEALIEESNYVLNYLDFRGKEYYLNINEEIYATVEPLQECVDQLPFVVAHTGVKHHSGNFHRPIRERWLEGEEMVVNGYREIAHLAREGKKALIKKDWDELAYLMNKNHEIQNEICDSGEQNNYMISIAKRNGALAAKLAGAGGGGTIIALTFKPERVKKALKECGASDFVDLYPGCPGTAVEYEGNDERYMAVHG
jgi:mevalonate kinase